ncbi:MAG: methionyl-tRNA formyltransferase [Dehalococcoidia bacterium]
MKIALIGQSAFGKSVLEALVEQGDDEIVGVFAPPTKEGRSPDPIIEAANDLKVPVFEFKRLRDQEAVDQFKSLEPELCVMAFVTDIVPMDMINLPALGTIQYHPSLLPLHRGPSSINWPIINGETETGLTIFWPDEGLDTGPVLMQKHVTIAPDATLGSVYFSKLYPLGVEAMIESVNLVRNGSAPRTDQDHSKATYESWCKASDVAVDWSAETSTVFNMIRGGDPQPGANTTFNGTKLSLYDAELSSHGSEGHGPGAAVEIGAEKVIISTSNGSIAIGRVRAAGAKKIGAGEWAKSVDLKVGDKFGS